MKLERNQLDVNRLHPHLGNIYYELEDEKKDGKYNLAPRRMRTIHLQRVPMTDITQKFVPLATHIFPIKNPIKLSEFVAQYKNRTDNTYCTISVITTFSPLQRRIKTP